VKEGDLVEVDLETKVEARRKRGASGEPDRR